MANEKRLVSVAPQIIAQFCLILLYSNYWQVVGYSMLQVFLRIYFSVFDRGSGSVDEARCALKCSPSTRPRAAEARIGFAKANSGADAKSRLKDAGAGVLSVLINLGLPQPCWNSLQGLTSNQPVFHRIWAASARVGESARQERAFESSSRRSPVQTNMNKFGLG